SHGPGAGPSRKRPLRHGSMAARCSNISARTQAGKEEGSIMLTGVCFVALIFGGLALAAEDSSVTFNRDVLPILQKNCQTCHRPGEVAPMSLLTYTDTRPWAKAIKKATIEKQMPPWFADPNYGHFKYDRRLSDADLKTLSDWADNGSPEG